jgi:hypothetical protein
MPIVYARGIRIVMSRASLLVTILALAILGSSCENLVRRTDTSIPKRLTPLTEAPFDDLVKQVRQFTDLQSLRTSPVYIRFLDSLSSQRYFEANSILALQRPDKIRLIIQAPAIGSRIADMVSEGNKFKVAIFLPEEYRRFLIGTNDADYSAWLAKIGDKGKSALAAARPFHFTEALMMRPLHIGDQRFYYSLEESLIEESDTRKGAKKNARVLRSFYVISEIEISPSSEGRAKMRRRFWFDRTNGARFSRQQIFDDRGGIATDVYYSNYMKLNASSEDLWPSMVLVSRPNDDYMAKLTFNDERFDVNPSDMKAEAFILENKDKLPEIDLDKPNMP